MKSSDAMDEGLSLGLGLSILERGLHRQRDEELKAGARVLEKVLDDGLVARKWEPLVASIAGLSYDSVGENNRARRLYFKLTDAAMGLPVSEVLYGSPEASRILTKCIADFGLRRVADLRSGLETVLNFCKKERSERKSVSPSDDLLVLLSMISLMNSYCVVQTAFTGLEKLASEAQTLSDSVVDMDVSAWLSPLLVLFARTLGSSVRRSILTLPVADYLKRRLITQTKTDLWPPQLEAVEKGLFAYKNLVYATPPGSGKTMLALLAAANSSPEKKTVYAVPTRTLAEEAYHQLKETVESESVQVAISTRDHVEYDDILDQTSILVTTYEKLGPLQKRGKLSGSNINRLLIDEVQKLSDEGRGILLEFILTKYKTLVGAEDPQIIAISGIIRKEDANGFSNWLNSTLVSSEWKPVDLDEAIFCEGKLYHKDGNVESTLIGSNKSSGSRVQRIQIATQLARRGVVQGGQCIIAIESRRAVENVARLLRDFFSTAEIDPDLHSVIEQSRSITAKLSEEIRSIEPELSTGYARLADLLKWGVAYHHGGMPSALREIVERGVREKGIRALVTTTTLEAGVNLPVSHIIFPFASGGAGFPMKIATYRNLAARAGRPGFDTQGQAVIITLSEDESKRVRAKYFESEPEKLDSAVQYFLAKRPPARYSIQSQILSVAQEDGTVEREDISSLMTKTWFWNNALGETRKLFLDGVSVETCKLCKYGFLQQVSPNEFKVTPSGKAAAHSTLSPFSTKLLLDNLSRILNSGYKGSQFDSLIMGLVGLPFESEEYDEYLKDVPIPLDLEFISKVIVEDPQLREKYQRVAGCPRYAALLKLWVGGKPVDEILERCGLDPSVDASLLEGTLPNDASWVLSSLLEMPGAILKTNAEQRSRIERIAMFCKYGTNDAIAIGLMAMGFHHMGRGTAIKLANYLTFKNKDLKSLMLEDLNLVFPGKSEASALLLEEIMSRFQKK